MTQPVIVNVQICNALVHRFLRRLQRIQSEPAGNHSRPHQHNTENSKRNQRRIDGRLDVCIVLFPEIPGGKHRAPRIRPQRKRHQDIHDRIGGADRRQSRLPRKTPGNDRVRQRVQLLKDRAAEQRQRIFQQNFPRFVDRQICIHKNLPLPLASDAGQIPAIFLRCLLYSSLFNFAII